jgi:hypothetical protein
MDLLSRTLHFARLLAGVPHAPYLHGPSLRLILDLLAEMGISRRSAAGDFRQGGYALDDFCLYVRFRRGKAVRPLLIDSHLDHPAFVLDGKGQGVALGSLGLERVQRLLEQGPLDIRIFGPPGQFITLGRITQLDLAAKPIIQVEAPAAVPANSHGVWNVADFEVAGDTLLMHSADNMIVTAVMLALIEQIATAPEDFPHLDVTFVFTFLEEIFEASATALAMKRRTPFGQIDDRWVIIVLESMETIPLAYQNQQDSAASLIAQDLRQLRQTDERWVVSLRSHEPALLEQNMHPLYKTFGLSLPNPAAGAAIKINDIDCVYGYEYPDQPNYAESLLLATADALGVAYQHTLYGGACNGTAFSLFPTSSHIATLSVPNPLKHNMDFDGRVVAEQVKLADIESVARIVRRVIESADQEVPHAHPAALSQQLKRTSLTPHPAIARRLRAERGTVAWSARWRLRKRRYFGGNLPEHLAFRLWGGASRIREPMFRLMG